MSWRRLFGVGMSLAFVYPAAFGQRAGSQRTLILSSIPRPLVILNTPEVATVTHGKILTLAAKKGTNLFNSPDGNYSVQDAPMALFQPNTDFLLQAKVTAHLKDVYDVAALVIYEDEKSWAKLCFENSATKDPTIVSVVTREYSDDANAATVTNSGVFLAMAKKGPEISFHYSTDGKTWRLVRDFRMSFHGPIRIGFAVHSYTADHFHAAFSQIKYVASSPPDMRQVE